VMGGVPLLRERVGGTGLGRWTRRKKLTEVRTCISGKWVSFKTFLLLGSCFGFRFCLFCSARLIVLGISEEESSGKLDRNGFLYVLFSANLGFALLASVDSLPVVLF
jgi:hypothetical protein